jgi:hypothetical protein
MTIPIESFCVLRHVLEFIRQNPAYHQFFAFARNDFEVNAIIVKLIGITLANKAKGKTSLTLANGRFI